MTTAPASSGISTESRNWGAIGHLSAFVQFIGVQQPQPLQLSYRVQNSNKAER